MPAFEWLTFVCTHSLGSKWKEKFVETPWYVREVMKNGKIIFIISFARLQNMLNIAPLTLMLLVVADFAITK